MSAVNLLSSLRQMSLDESLKDGSKPEGEEELSPRGVGGGGGDPAVLALGPARKVLVYTRDELMHFKNSPLAKQGFEAALQRCEALAPRALKKRPDSPNDEDRGGKGDAPNDNQKQGVYGRERDRERRSADPRERVRKESEPSAGGIVLSPQRRSFVSGCGAAVPKPRPESPPPIHPAAKPDAGGRRIGSGRIMVRDMAGGWEREEGERPDREPYRAPRVNADRDRFEHRSFGRDSYSSDIKREREDRFNNDNKMRAPRDDNRRDDMRRDDMRRDEIRRDDLRRDDNRRDDRRSGGRYNQRRYDKDEEPEWFSGGPTSQLETIELRGFDEPRDSKRNSSGARDEKWNNSNSSSNNTSATAAPKSPPPPPNERWREPPQDSPPAGSDTSNDKDSGVETKSDSAAAGGEQPDFNLDEFLKFDTIPDVLTNGGNGAGEAEGSRFSRWFRRDSPQDTHYERLLHNIVDELETPAQQPAPSPGANQHVFAPIAPAPSLLELLRRANQDKDDHGDMNPSGGGKIHSLEELEARLRPQPSPHADRDLSAFKRLLAQVSGGHAVPAEPRGPPPAQPPQPPQPQPMSLLQMLNKSVEQQKAQQQQQQQPPHIPQELLYKLLQVQRQQQQELPGAPSAADRELLQRPEAQAIIHGLKAGEITVQHLIQQLGNPGLQSRHRELLTTILHQHQIQRQRQMGVGGGGHSPLPAPHLVVPPHHQPLRLSPLPHPTFCVSPIMPTSPNTLAVHHPGVPPRIPSPRELAVHTQTIMQSALIKKKLEEQRENYRRRHEQPRHTPISFTPTSVLRKMTAEKEAEAPSPKQQWNQPPKVPQGRPIVKGNQSGGPPVGFSQSQVEYQQFLNQQQNIPGMRNFPHQQQRQMPPNQMNNMSNIGNMSNLGNMGSLAGMGGMGSMGSMGGMGGVGGVGGLRGVPGGTTLHQLLVQSHQRSLNEMGGGPMGTGGGDNQLARWFSPELLARASAGKLPSVHVPNALSLEELERAHHSPAVRN